MYYRQCEICGASLDPGEKCDCDDHKPNVKIETIQLRKVRRIGNGTKNYIVKPRRMVTT